MLYVYTQLEQEENSSDQPNVKLKWCDVKGERGRDRTAPGLRHIMLN